MSGGTASASPRCAAPRPGKGLRPRHLWGVAFCHPEMRGNGKLGSRNLLPDPLYNAERGMHNPSLTRMTIDTSGTP
ncbi:MAG TPA: hypothetical protein VF844_14075 [Ktedonobacteraceae bacterium]